MKVKWIRLCKWLLGVLGISASISSCTVEYGPAIQVEYGQPNMDYSVKGKVVDSETGAGVQGIEVSHEMYGKQVDTTGIDGSFEISGNTFPLKEFKVQLKDIDPEKGGSYKSKEEIVPLTKIKDGKGHWNEGTFEARDVVLKAEKEDGE